MTYELMRTTMPDGQRDEVADIVRAHHHHQHDAHSERSRATAVKIADELDAKYGSAWSGIVGPHYAVYAREDDATFFRCKVDEQIYTFWKNVPSGKPAGQPASGNGVCVPITVKDFELMRTTMPDWQRDEVTTLIQDMSLLEEQTNFSRSRATMVAITEKLDAKYGGKWSGVLGPHYAVYAREDAGTFYRCKIDEQIYTVWKNTSPGEGSGRCGGGGGGGGNVTAAQIQSSITVHDFKMEDWMKTRSIEVIATGLAEHAGSADEFTVWVAHRLDDLLGVGYGWKCFDETGRWTCHHQKAAQYNLRINYMTHYVTVWFYGATGTQQQAGEHASFANEETTLHTAESFSSHQTSSGTWGGGAALGAAAGAVAAGGVAAGIAHHYSQQQGPEQYQSPSQYQQSLSQYQQGSSQYQQTSSVQQQFQQHTEEDDEEKKKHHYGTAAAIGAGALAVGGIAAGVAMHKKHEHEAQQEQQGYQQQQFQQQQFQQQQFQQQQFQQQQFEEEDEEKKKHNWGSAAAIGAGALAVGGIAAGVAVHKKHEHEEQQEQQAYQKQHFQQQSGEEDEEKKHNWGSAAAIGTGALAVGGVAAAVAMHKKHEHEEQQEQQAQHGSSFVSQQGGLVAQIQSQITVHDCKMEEGMKNESIQVIATGLAEHASSVDEFTGWVAHRLDQVLRVGTGWRCFDETGRWTCHHQKAAQYNLRINYGTHYVTVWFYPGTSTQQQFGEHATFGNETTTYHTSETFTSQQSSSQNWNAGAVGGVTAGMAGMQLQQQGGEASQYYGESQSQQYGGQAQYGQGQFPQPGSQDAEEDEKKKHNWGTAAAIGAGALAVGGIAAGVAMHKKHEHEREQEEGLQHSGSKSSFQGGSFSQQGSFQGGSFSQSGGYQETHSSTVQQSQETQGGGGFFESIASRIKGNQ